jgi:antitoxin MazE
METLVKVAKWGNSLAIRIPRDVAEALGIEEGDDIDLRAGEVRALLVDRKMRRTEAIEGLRKFRGRLPDGFKFDRDEANAR